MTLLRESPRYIQKLFSICPVRLLQLLNFLADSLKRLEFPGNLLLVGDHLRGTLPVLAFQTPEQIQPCLHCLSLVKIKRGGIPRILKLSCRILKLIAKAFNSLIEFRIGTAEGCNGAKGTQPLLKKFERSIPAVLILAEAAGGMLKGPANLLGVAEHDPLLFKLGFLAGDQLCAFQLI